jgi:FMN phosphatase YigB (HAD superfamily)
MRESKSRSEQPRAESGLTLDDLLSVEPGAIVRDLWRGRFLWRDHGPPVISWGRARVPRLATFDVFDTLITRASIDPEAVWVRMAELVSQQASADVDTNRLVEARRAAEHDLRGRQRRHPVLEAIHEEMCRQLGWDVSLAARSALAEIQAEREMSRPIPAGIELLRSTRQQFPRVVYASDMYLPSPLIHELLQLHGCWKDGDTLWVSSQAGARKRTGELFQRIAAAESVTPADLVHVGDQPVADSAAPRWVGLHVAPFRPAVPSRYERALAEESSIGSRLGDAARLTRVSGTRTLAPEITDVATGVIGPFLAGYSLWLLRAAQERELGRLYFLSRDGEIIRAATEAVARALGEGPELRYLHGGRMAWKLPATEVSSDESWNRFLDELLMKHTRVTATGVALRLGLAGSQLAELIRTESEVPLNPADRARLKWCLMTDQLREEVAAHAEEQRKLAIAYLVQEGLGESQDVALVDVGWIGSTMRALADLLAGWTEPPLSLFVGYSGPDRGLPGGQDAYLWGGSETPSTDGTGGLGALVEMFCAGSHGAVTGYEEHSGLIQPRLLSPVSVAASSWPLVEMQKTVMRFFGALGPTLRPADLEAETRPLVMKVMRLFRDDPSRDEAETWGSFPREEDPQGGSVFPMARPYRITDLTSVVRPGPFAGRNLSWPQAAKARTPVPLRLVFEGTFHVMTLARRLREGVTREGRPPSGGV